MPAVWNPQVNAIFLQVLEQPPAEREAFLQQACGGDSALAAQVRSLLAAGEQAGSFLDSPAINALPAFDQPLAGPGTQIGPYKLIEQIGEGGMGTVWMAQQSGPVKRLVAVKLIKAGMDSRQVIARFEAERQALALMDHPNIARVLDGGSTSAGRPYFVMDLVRGTPITRYCDEHHLTPRQRLELFIPVCQAIQHAHQKGIIHRDLKPTNVLVALYDGRPVPKIIDFGVAKAAGQPLTERTLVTGFGAIVGTLEYMSPEQAEFNQLDIDTRSDIYSLGVLLYELLTGSTPLTHKWMKEAAYAEILRMIKEVEPPRPSTRLSDSGEALASISADRHMEPAKLTKLVKGELDWIVMKALEKDRNRRYETANGFAMDVQRYLADEQVLACSPTAGYRLWKFARRHKGPLLAASLLVVALIGGIIGTTVGLVRAEQRAEGERQARVAAEKAEKAARESDADTKAFSEFLVTDILWVARPAGQRGGLGIDVTVRQALEASEQKIEATFQNRPRAEAVARHALGVTFRLIGEPLRAEPHLRRAASLRRQELGPDHEDTLQSQNSLSVLLVALAKYDEATPLLEETLTLRQAKLGPDHPHTLASMEILAASYQAAGENDRALPLYEETYKRRLSTRGPVHPETLISMSLLGSGYQAAGQAKRALALYEEAFKLLAKTLGPAHPDTLASMRQLARGYHGVNRLDLALPLCEKSLKLHRETLGPNHPETLASMTSLAGCYSAARKYDLALPLAQEALPIQMAKLGPHHPDTLISMMMVASCHAGTRKLELALPLFEKALQLQRERKLGADHSLTLLALNNLVQAYLDAGKFDLALPLAEEALKLQTAKSGPHHGDTVSSMMRVAACYRRTKRPDLALPLYEKALQHQKEKHGSDQAVTLLWIDNLAQTYMEAGKLEPALPLFQEVAAGVEKRQFSDERAQGIVYSLMMCHEQLMQFEQAEPWRRKLVAMAQEKSEPESFWHNNELSGLGANLLAQKKFADAEAVLRECLASRQKSWPNEWFTFNTQSLLGAALLGQKKYAEAEPFLLQGYEGMKEREAQMPADYKDVRLRAALERLVQLYEAWDKNDEAVEWRKKLETQATDSGAKQQEPEKKPN